jgi:hypothetical protein
LSQNSSGDRKWGAMARWEAGLLKDWDVVSFPSNQALCDYGTQGWKHGQFATASVLQSHVCGVIREAAQSHFRSPRI